MKRREATEKTVLSGLFLAMAMLLPFLTGQIEHIGQMLCPMHIPVLLCGVICGPLWGATVGAATPLLRSAWLGMPPIFPKGVAMAFELAAYGVIAGLLWRLPLFKKSGAWARLACSYVCLVAAMLGGRLVYGGVMLCLMASKGADYSLTAWYATALAEAVPGIVAQLVLIPPVVSLYEHYGRRR